MPKTFYQSWRSWPVPEVKRRSGQPVLIRHDHHFFCAVADTHKLALPELPEFRILLYLNDGPQSLLAHHLASIVRDAYHH